MRPDEIGSSGKETRCAGHAKNKKCAEHRKCEKTAIPEETAILEKHAVSAEHAAFTCPAKHGGHALRTLALKILPSLTAAALIFVNGELSSRAAVRKAGPGETERTEASLAGYSEEKWASLKDNLLEYEEIEDLVKNFNPSVSNSWEQYEESISDNEQLIRDLKSRQKSVHSDAENAEKSGDIAVSAANKAEDRMLTSVISQLGTANEKMSRINASGSSSIRSTERSVSHSAKTLMIAYCSARNSLSGLNELVTLRKDLLGDAEVRQSAGSGTAAETAQAESDLLTAEASANSLESTADDIRRQLIVLCGWKSGDTPEIGELPATDFSERLAAMDPETDIQTAIAKNLDRASYLAEDHKDGTSVLSARNQREEEINQTIRINMNSAYNAVKEAENEYEARKISLEQAEAEKKSADAKYSAGMLSRSDYDEAMVSYRNAEVNFSSAESSLFSALEDYDWYKTGNCPIS